MNPKYEQECLSEVTPIASVYKTSRFDQQINVYTKTLHTKEPFFKNMDFSIMHWMVNYIN